MYRILYLVQILIWKLKYCVSARLVKRTDGKYLCTSLSEVSDSNYAINGTTPHWMCKASDLIHLPLVPHICASELDPENGSALVQPKATLTYCQLHPWNKLHWNSDKKRFFHENTFEYVFCETAAILSRGGGGDALSLFYGPHTFACDCMYMANTRLWCDGRGVEQSRYHWVDSTVVCHYVAPPPPDTHRTDYGISMDSLALNMRQAINNRHADLIMVILLSRPCYIH